MRWLDGIIDSIGISLGEVWVGNGQGVLACCSPWGHKESDMTERLKLGDCYVNAKCCTMANKVVLLDKQK